MLISYCTAKTSQNCVPVHFDENTEMWTGVVKKGEGYKLNTTPDLRARDPPISPRSQPARQWKQQLIAIATKRPTPQMAPTMAAPSTPPQITTPDDHPKHHKAPKHTIHIPSPTEEPLPWKHARSPTPIATIPKNPKTPPTPTDTPKLHQLLLSLPQTSRTRFSHSQ